MKVKHIVVSYINENENTNKLDVEIDVENPIFLSIRDKDYSGATRNTLIPWSAVKNVRVTAV